MSNLIAAIEAKHQKTDIPDFRAGDTVRVHAKIIEGEKERVQVFEGGGYQPFERQRQPGDFHGAENFVWGRG